MVTFGDRSSREVALDHGGLSQDYSNRFDIGTSYNRRCDSDDYLSSGALGIVLSYRRGGARILASPDLRSDEGASRRRSADSSGADLRPTLSSRIPGLVDASRSWPRCDKSRRSWDVSCGSVRLAWRCYSHSVNQPLLAAALAAL